MYHAIQKKVRTSRLKTKAAIKCNPNIIDSILSTNSMAISDDELTNLIKELDIDGINRDVFNLYYINYGLDTTLALRKVQVLETEDEVFKNYLDCLKDVYDLFLSYIF